MLRHVTFQWKMILCHCGCYALALQIWGQDCFQELSGFPGNHRGEQERLFVVKVLSDRFDMITNTYSSWSYSTACEMFKNETKVGLRVKLMLLTSDLLSQIKQNSHCKDVVSPLQTTVLCFPTWALTSVKRQGPWNICVVIVESMISPPPCLQTSIPPILTPKFQIASTFMKEADSQSVNSCFKNLISQKVIWTGSWF